MVLRAERLKVGTTFTAGCILVSLMKFCQSFQGSQEVDHVKMQEGHEEGCVFRWILVQLAGVSQDKMTQRTPNVHVSGPGLQKTPPEFHEHTHERRNNNEHLCGRKEKSATYLPPSLPSGHPPFCSHTSGLPTFLAPTRQGPTFPGSGRPHFGLPPFVQDTNARLLLANLNFDSRFQHVSCNVPDECPDYREFRVYPVFPRYGRRLILTSGLVQRTFHVAHSCDEYPCFYWSLCCLGSTALEFRARY